MRHHRHLVAAVLLLLLRCTVHIRAQDGSAAPDYRPRIEVQHTEFAIARANFKTQLRRIGPVPTAWGDVVVPAGASDIAYPSGSLRLKAWLSLPADSKKHPAVLYLHSGFDFSMDSWDLVRPFRDAGYVVMLPTMRGENGQHGVFAPTMLASELYPHFRAAASISGTPDVA